DIDGRDQALDRAELIDHHDQLPASGLERVDEVENPDGFVNNDRRAQRPLVQRLALKEIGDGVFGAAYADAVVARSPADGKESMRSARDFFAYGFRIVLNIDPRDVGARRHDRMHRAVGQAQYAAYHVALFDAEGKFVGRLRGSFVRSLFR